ncbi:MAG: response regulator [Candidatus Heimdallarchaeota archaeon]|nr:response regulator [Candidatus Heimdallarchaeota archaeon]
MSDSNSSIMIVDDDPMIRKLIGRMLKVKGYESVQAESGDEALELTKQHVISAAIVDLHMPGLSGEDTIKEFAKKYPKIKLILSTGDGMTIDKEYFKSIGVSIFLNKPFDMDDLFQAIS